MMSKKQGYFASCDPERLKEISRKGGQSGHVGKGRKKTPEKRQEEYEETRRAKARDEREKAGVPKEGFSRATIKAKNDAAKKKAAEEKGKGDKARKEGE